ncbi:hypothetical protein [Glaciimonas soli]|uniref:Uncharacterized protein n=1 Tax=Glaciimonas soli TaxID=2590999 RepID=A0A843YYP1_9BURK|nr:hypothetical protein [Glaciimonas soli]MQR02381.1 hypothetical protein [Glaciimonas soli]
MLARWKVWGCSLFCLCGALAVTTLHAAEIHFSSQRDFDEINLNIKDQAYVGRDFVILDVTLTPEAQKRLTEISDDTSNQELSIILDGKAIHATTVRSALNSNHLKISLTRKMARDVFPSLLASPVSSVTLSGFSMPDWGQGKWEADTALESPDAEYIAAPGEAISIAAKTIDASGCRHVNHTVVSSNDNIIELQLDRRSKCVINDVPVSRIVLSRSYDANRMMLSLYAIGSDFSGAPDKESTYQRQ